MNCKRCLNKVIKNGFQKNGKQRYYCKICKKSFQESYKYKAYKVTINPSIRSLVINSCGITDISRLLSISRNTINSRLLKMAQQVPLPMFNEQQQCYEIDELFTRINGKIYWIIYAINRITKKVIYYVVGKRTKENLEKVVRAVQRLNPETIYTDKLSSYKSLIPKGIHNTKRYQTNKIERLNLTLRTHLKRLSRKTICYSKRVTTLEAILKIYFWGDTINLKTYNLCIT